MTPESKKFAWVKFRTKHASGPGTWEYREVAFRENETKEDALRNLLENLDDELSTHSEYWRGIEGDFEDPPIEYLERKIKAFNERIAACGESISRWTHQINDRGNS